MKRNVKDKGLTMVGSFLLILSVLLMLSKIIYNAYLNKQESIKIEEFFEEQEQTRDINEVSSDEKEETNSEHKSDYIAVIKIPKINLEKGLYDVNDINNNVDKNIQILKSSSYPDVIHGNFILASHNGNSRVSYFRNINKLEYGDYVSIFYKNKEYKYKVMNMYEIEKNGTANIIRNKEKTTLTLITCRHNTNKQIVVICELVETL